VVTARRLVVRTREVSVVVVVAALDPIVGAAAATVAGRSGAFAT
jgi:hypothetical protein